MKEFAICFEWKKSIEDSEICLQEYFVPYTRKTLSSLFRDSVPNICSSLDDKNEAYHIVSDDSLNNKVEIRENRINDEQNLNENSLWDYLSEANAIISLYKNHGNGISDNKDLYDNELLSQIYLHNAKIDISIIINIEWNNFSIFEREVIEFFHYLNEILSPLKYKSESERNNLKGRIYDNLNTYQPLNSFIFDRISSMKQIFSSETIPTYSHLKNAFIKPFFRNAANANEICRIRKGYLYEVNNKYNLDKSKNDICDAMFLDNSNVYRWDLINGIIDNIHNIFNKVLLKSDFDRFVKFMSSTSAPYSKKYHNNPGCFALMKEANGITYFALSGMKDHANEANNLKELASIIMKECFNENVDSTNIRKQIFNYNWAYCTDDVLRYIELDDNIIYIYPPIKLGDDLTTNWAGDKDRLGRYYSCCERKLLAFSQNDEEKTFFIRWAPCEKCRPALFETRGNKKIYALAFDYNSWLKNGNKSDIKEYKIKKAYTLI